MKKRYLMLLLLMVATMCVPLSAKEIMITWEWDLADPLVTASRYQLDGQDPDKWITVDSTVTSYTYGPVADTEPHTLYVQLSYDGLHWSESGSLGYDPVAFGAVQLAQPEPVAEIPAEPVAVAQELPAAPIEVEPAPAVEPFVLEEEEIEPIEPIAEPVTEMAPVATVVPEPVRERKSRVELHLGAGGKADNLVLTSSFDPGNDFKALRTRIIPVVSADYVQDSLFDFSEKVSLGVRAGVGLHGYETATSPSTFIGGFDVHALGLATYAVNERFSLDAALGFTFMFTGNTIQNASSDIGVFFGPAGQGGLRYRINESWSVSVQGEIRLLFANQFMPYELTGTVRFGVGYHF